MGADNKISHKPLLFEYHGRLTMNSFSALGSAPKLSPARKKRTTFSNGAWSSAVSARFAPPR